MGEQSRQPPAAGAPWWERAHYRFYVSRSGWVDGTTEFHGMVAARLRQGGLTLEIGAGPANKTSRMLREQGQVVVGLDIEDAFRNNEALHHRVRYDGMHFPFAGGVFDAAVADMVMEHVADPASLATELARVLKPGGYFCFRTPQRFGYVAFISAITPHWFHRMVANRLRRLPAGTHDPWPTVYRCNTKSRVKKVFEAAGFSLVEHRPREKQPSYGRASRLLYYPMVLWERIVNSTSLFSGIRNSMYVVVEKRQG